MHDNPSADHPVAELFPLLWSDDPGRIADWAIATLGLTESWRFANEAGLVEHAELLWPGGRVSLSLRHDTTRPMGPAGIALRIDVVERVKAIHQRAVEAGATIIQGPELTRVAYSFTAVDPDGNQWWVNAETGFLDSLRQQPSRP